MKHLKSAVAVALAAMALLAVAGVGTASATTLEVNGVTRNESVTIAASLKAGTSMLLRDTLGFSLNTCLESNVHGSTTSSTTAGKTTDKSYTGEQVTAPISSLTFNKCNWEPVVIHNAGQLHITHIAGTTNGTVTSSAARITTESPFGTLECLTGAGTHLGTLTGVSKSTEHATIDINAALPCSGISSRLTATYTVTSPTGLGVSA